MEPTVAVIVLNYNGKHLLKDCLASLKTQTYKDYWVWVLDNASCDNSIQYIKRNFPWVKIIKNRQNDGTAKGSNIAALNTQSKYMVFVSNDIRLDKNCLKVLTDTLDLDNSIGICTSKLLRLEKDKKTKKYLIDNMGGNLDIYGFGWPKYALKKTGKWEKQQEVFFSYGGCFIITRSLFERLGGYDNKFFTLGDDIDLSWRIRLLGYKVVVNPKAFVYHKISATLKKIYHRPKKRYWSERNCLRTLLKNYELKSLLLILPRYLLIECLEIGFFLFMQKGPLMAFAIIKAFLWNMLYLADTLKERVKIQRLRIIKDEGILQLMSKKSFKLNIPK